MTVSKDRVRVEKAVGRLLKTTEEVHHHTDGTLVACENHAYHRLLHQRTRALEACGHASWRKCCFCGKYDDPENMTIVARSRQAYHVSCKRRDRWDREKRKEVKSNDRKT